MSSSHRPAIQPIPPFKGGPLQATDVQNRRPSPAEAYVALANRKAGANVISTRVTGSENRPSHASSAATSTARHPQQQSRHPAAPAVDRRPPQQQAADRQKPASRLEREKKRNHNDPKNIGHWRLDKLIGQGASGRVRLAVHEKTGQKAAVKIIPRTLINASRMSLRDADVKANKMILGIEREIVIMKLIEHPNLLGLWDVYETSKDLFLIMEYVAGGELFDHLVAQGKLTPRDARSYFRQIIFGMDYCHRFNICHRDLKPENLLLDETKKIVKVADFGMAALQPTEKMLETSCGSPHYASPEIVSGKRYKGTASDIWSCGIILFALLCGRLPFDDPNIQQLLGKVRAGKFIMPEWLEPQSKDLIWRMLEVDPEKRIKMADIMRHPWFTNNGRETSANPVATSFDSLHLEELTPETIDCDILGNLKTLWSEISEEDIVKELLAPGPSWQKTFYTLLVAHRENHSADDEEQDFFQEEIVTANTVPAHALLVANNAGRALEKARPRRNADPSSGSSAPSSPRLESVEMDRRHSTPEKGSSQVSPTRASPLVRPANPSPRLPAPYADSHLVTPTKITPSSPTKAAAQPHLDSENRLPQIALHIASPPRNERSAVEMQRRASSPSQKPSASATNGPASSRMAIASLQDASGRPRLNRNSPSEMMAPLPLPSRASSRPVSPIKPMVPSQMVGTSPQLQRPSTARAHTTHGATSSAAPSIQVPQVGDATMQKFFQEIADELASIRATGEKPDGLQSKIDQLKSSVAAQRAIAQQQQQATIKSIRPTSVASSHGSSAGVRSPGTKHSEMNQFEDAEDDVSEAESLRSVSETSTHSTHPYTPQTPMTPLSPAENIVALGAAEKARSSVMMMPASAGTRGSIRSARTTASTATTASVGGSTSRAASVLSNISTGSSGLGRKRSLLGLRKDKNVDDGTIKSVAYEQAQASSHAPPQTLANVFTPPQQNNANLSGAASHANPSGSNPTPSRVQKLNPGLGLDIGSTHAYSAATNSLKGVASPPATPLSPTSTAPGKKDSWFAGLFNWKPATFTLMSTESLSETLSECVARLQSYGVRVAMEDTWDTQHATLKCTISEYRESNGVVTMAKPLRFRVELTMLPVGSTNSPQLGLGLNLHGVGINGLPSPALSTYSKGSSAGSHSGASGVLFATSVQVVQEKGALSTFKLMHGRLRREWSLDHASAII